MPRDVLDNLLDGIPTEVPQARAYRRKTFEEFVLSVERKAQKRKPVRTKVSLSGTLFAKRNTRIAIREAALRGVTIIILYQKVTTGELKKYEVLPLSYRYNRLKAGWRKVLFVQDIRDHKQTKRFVLRNIYKVALTDKKVKANWLVEIQ